MFKIVDESASLGISTDYIDTKEELYDVIRKHFTGLLSGDEYNPAKADDEALFWALSCIYVVEDDIIYLRSRIGEVYCPVYDVKVTRSDKTSICVKPYKVDGYSEHIISDIYYIDVNEPYTVDPLEVMGWKVDNLNGWKGTVWVRTGFTGWNTIECEVDESLRESL